MNCIERNVLKDYLLKRGEEVTTIMLSILDQNAATQAMIAKERRGAARSAQIQTTVEMCQNFGKSISDAILLLMQNFSLTESASRSLVDQYWKV